MADSKIAGYLKKIMDEVYGKDVRQAIHDSISQCYEDVNSPTLNANAIEAVVQKKIDDGTIPAMAIPDGSVTQEKLSSDIHFGVNDGEVTFEKLGFGEACNSADAYFTGNIVDDTTKVYGVFGKLIACKPGDTLYCNFKLSKTNITAVQILDNVPSSNSGALTGVVGTLPQSEDNIYTIPSDLTSAKAAFFPVKFWSYPGEKIEQYGKESKYQVQDKPFDLFNAWYNKSQDKSFIVDDTMNKTLYASLFKAVSDMVGAKVFVSGDSITAQSAGSGYDGDGWYSRIARKYMQEFTASGNSGMLWYPREEGQASAVTDVKNIVASGIEYDYIILEWGTNDITLGSFGDATDVSSDAVNAGTVAAMRYCIETLQSNLPGARIIVVLPCMRNGSTRQEQYYSLAEPILKSYGVRRVYMAWDSGITLDMMRDDGIHLNKPIEGSNGYTNNTEAVARYSRCLEAEMLRA